MKVLCIAIGSAGDVHPFVGIGLAMKRRGHDVALATNGHFRSLVENAGLRFIELGTAEDYRKGIADPRIWKRTTAFKAVMEFGVLPLVKPTYDIAAREHVPGDTVVVGSSLAMGVRVAQDKLGVPAVMCHLSPALFLSIEDPPVLPGMILPRWFPAWLKRGMWSLAHRRLIDPVISPAINGLRRELGLAAVKNIMVDWWHSPGKTLALFPEWFAHAPDWPEQLVQTQFPLYDEAGVSHVSPELAAFLKAGDPPIAFTAGTAMVQGHAFFETSVRVTSQLKRRAILLTRHPEQLPASLPANVFHAAYAPFGELLPQCAALVHHGGIGTTAQALRAGIPQLIYPMAHDQLDNANRLERLGVGDHVHPKRYTVSRVARKLEHLLNDAAVKIACTNLKSRFEGIDPLAQTCDEVESVARGPALSS